jgi:regulator of protease activity HflC (stomatin/prohibitin superfamily)
METFFALALTMLLIAASEGFWRRPMHSGRRSFSGSSLVALIALTSACATVPPGYGAVVTLPWGIRSAPLTEGVSWVGPWSTTDLLDLRAQERNEDLRGLAADGAPVQANASVVTWHLVPGELVAFDREVGPGAYPRVIRPIVQAAVRRVVAGYPVFELMDTRNLPRIQKAITDLAAGPLREMHIQLDSVFLRSLLPTSDALNAAIVDTSRLEQHVLALPHEIEVARSQAQVRREQGLAQKTADRDLDPTLTSKVIADARQRAWTALLVSPATSVFVSPESVPRIEVSP